MRVMRRGDESNCTYGLSIGVEDPVSASRIVGVGVMLKWDCAQLVHENRFPYCHGITEWFRYCGTLLGRGETPVVRNECGSKSWLERDGED